MTNGERSNLRDKAYVRFTQQLLARELRPGQFVSQRQLVELTGLPLAAIRELIPRLETEGLITTIPQRGLQIASIDVNLIRDAFQFRLFLEREAVMEFARTASPAALAEARQNHTAIVDKVEALSMNEQVPLGLVHAAQEVDHGFHNTIIEALHNKVISDAYRVNAMKISLVRQEQGRLFNEIVKPTMRDHLAVIDALEARDPQRAAEAMTTHIMKGRNRALGIG
ncbi:GntR family transcriptional regulator [Martelella sp. AD-3]|uniref:GntR family transcriptional regulator n=1 Tax=Martelella sp. AD-3 TaxID=686597 RepID=UPI0004642B29|nr:GntR family transcriptional regulator [Martelella sp. AD-3]AMM84047.1 GntR family transcriptional regulator [Martelella sp. AD-3]